MRNAKIGAAVVAALLVVLLAWQNTEPVEVRVLFWHPTMSRALLIALAFACGGFAGFGLGVWLRRSRKGAEPEG